MNSVVQINLPVRPPLVLPVDSHKESSTAADSPGMRAVHHLKGSISNQHVSSRAMSRSMSKEEGGEVDESEEESKGSSGADLLHQSSPSDSDANARPNPKIPINAYKADVVQHGVEGKEDQQQNGWAIGKSVLEVSRTLFHIKDVLIEKVASARPSLPADTLEHARRSIESMIIEATQSAYGRTRDIMVRIRLLLVEHIPSLSLQESKKIVDDVEREVLDSSLNTNPKETIMNRTSTVISTDQSSTSSATSNPRSPQLWMRVTNMDRIKSWPLFRSRL